MSGDSLGICPACAWCDVSPYHQDYKICNRCGTFWANKFFSHPPLREESDAVWKHSKEALFRRGLDLAERRVGIGRVLDIGCGHGYFLSLAKQRGWKTTGVEPYAPHAAFAREHFGLEIFTGDIFQARLPSESFDAIFLWGVLDVAEDPRKTLLEVHRLLRPGGLLFIRTQGSFKKSLFGLGRFFPSHPFNFTAKALRLLLLRSGTGEIHVRNSPPTLGDPYGQGFGVGFAKRLLFWMDEALFFMTGGRLAVGTSLVAWGFKMKERPQVIEIITRLDAGGSTETALYIASYLSDFLQVTFLFGKTQTAPEALVKQANEKGVSFLNLPSLRRDISFFNDILAFFHIYRFLRKTKPLILHAHSSKAGFLGRWAGWLSGVPFIFYMSHGHVFYGYAGRTVSRLFVLLERVTARITDRLLELTETGIEENLRFGISRRERFVVLHSGVQIPPPPHIYSLRALVPKGSLVVGSVGRLDPIKDYGTLIESASLVLREAPGTFFVLAGDGTEEERLKAKVQALGLQRNFIFTGWQENWEDVLPEMNIFALSSLNEGMGKVLVAASSRQIPIVATRVGGIPSVVLHEKTGLLVPPRDPEALASAMLRLLKDEPLRKKMGEAGRLHSQNFSMESMYEKARALYGDYIDMGSPVA